MSANPFATDDMAAGYASSRPPVHPEVLRLALPGDKPRRALDIGCGAGLSTAALQPFTSHAVGLEPAVSMLAWHSSIAPQSDFLAARAETLPFPAATFPLLTAAGSLNYVHHLPSFFAEAARVLTPGGELLVYDFSVGRAPFLEPWLAAFHQRFPPPASEALYLDPHVLSTLHPAFRLQRAESFRLPLRLSRSFYLNYMLTETNVAAAVRRGTPLREIRDWCASTLEAIWPADDAEIHFPGYYAFLGPTAA